MGEDVTIVLRGGLGNQLYQRAAGFVVARRTGLQVRMGVQWLGLRRRWTRTTQRSLDIPLSLSETSHSFVPSPHLLGLAARIGVLPPSWVLESSLNDDALVRVNKSTRLLVGYFQRLDYVEEAWPDVLQYLGAHTATEAVLTRDRASGVAVHMRLGDYLTNPSAAATHGTPDPEYYVRAITRMIDEGADPRVMLVSDDPGQARDRIDSVGLPRGVSLTVSESNSAWEDLAALSRASAVVMSNSTFSWWGAYIAHRTAGARVTYPTPWFVATRNEPPPVFPTSWAAEAGRRL